MNQKFGWSLNLKKKKKRQKKARKLKTTGHGQWYCILILIMILPIFTDEETGAKAVEGNALHCLAHQVQLQDWKRWLRVSVDKGETLGSLQPACLGSGAGSDPY